MVYDAFIDELNTYNIKKFERAEKLKNIYKYNSENKKFFSFYTAEKSTETKEKIYNYFKNKHFLNNKPDETFLFITYTLNPKYNIISENIDSQQLKLFYKTQNEIIENVNYQSTRNIENIDYIKVKEFTKKGNIHLHTLYKLKKENIKQFIKSLMTQKEKQESGIINIKITEKDKELIENEFLLYQFKEDKAAIFKKNTKEKDAQEILNTGNIIELQELKENGTKSIIFYILKYIEKNTEDSEKNKDNQEHAIFKILNIKKITTSNFTNEKDKAAILFLYYKLKNRMKTEDIDLFEYLENNREQIENEMAAKEKKVIEYEIINKEKNFIEYFNALKDIRTEKEDKLSEIYNEMEQPTDPADFLEKYLVAKINLENKYQLKENIDHELNDVIKYASKKIKTIIKKTKKHFEYISEKVADQIFYNINLFIFNRKWSKSATEEIFF